MKDYRLVCAYSKNERGLLLSMVKDSGLSCGIVDYSDKSITYKVFGSVTSYQLVEDFNDICSGNDVKDLSSGWKIEDLGIDNVVQFSGL